MAQLSPKARRYISDRIDEHLEEIEAAPLHNAVADADDGAPETLYHLATAAEAAFFAADIERNRDREDPVREGADDAFDTAHAALEAYVDELIAKACADLIQTIDGWEWPTDEQATASKQEAREWLQQHLDAARRAGVLEGLNAREGGR